MKYLTSLVVLTLSINCYGETNREILEDIRDQQMFMQFERDLKNAYGGNEQVRTQAQPNQSYLQIMGYSKIWQNSNVILYVRDSSITKLGGNSGHFLVSYLIQFNKPQYAEDKTFFMIQVISQSLSCKNSTINGGPAMGLNKEYKAVVNLGSSPLEKIPVGGILDKLKNYVCP